MRPCHVVSVWPKRKKQDEAAASSESSQLEHADQTTSKLEEASNAVDQNRDGVIEQSEQRALLVSLDTTPDDALLEAKLSEAPGPMTFGKFVEKFGEYLPEDDTESDNRNALGTIDTQNTGSVGVEELGRFLTIRALRSTEKKLGQVQLEQPVKDEVLESGSAVNVAPHGPSEKGTPSKKGIVDTVDELLPMCPERMKITGPEDVAEAFRCFDEHNTGFIGAARLRKLLTTFGDRLTDEEADEMMRELPLENGRFEYSKFKYFMTDYTEHEDKQ